MQRDVYAGALPVQYDLLPMELPKHPGVITSWVAWGEAMEGSARELLAKADVQDDPGQKSALEEAVEFLREELADGPKLAKRLLKDGSDVGHAKRTLERAKAQLGIQSKKHRDGWQWVLYG